MQVKQVKIQLPNSAKKDGIAMEKQLLNFQHLLEEGSDAEAAYLAEQLLIAKMQYLVQMYALALEAVLCLLYVKPVRKCSQQASVFLSSFCP